MKKIGLLNQPLSSVIAGLGHGDMLVIGDAGLPIPPGPQRIDLALIAGIPTFEQVLRAVLSEMQVESAIVASEIRAKSPSMHSSIVRMMGETPLSSISHEDFKLQTAKARAVVRTGEFTPYANIILVAGVVF